MCRRKQKTRRVDEDKCTSKICAVNVRLRRYLTKKKLTNLGTNSWSRGYEPGREDHEFEPRLGNFFLVRWKKK